MCGPGEAFHHFDQPVRPASGQILRVGQNDGNCHSDSAAFCKLEADRHSFSGSAAHFQKIFCLLETSRNNFQNRPICVGRLLLRCAHARRASG